MNTARIIRSRTIREALLRTLNAAYHGSPDVHVPAEQIYTGFARSRVPYAREEIDAEIVDLIDRGMIDSTPLTHSIGPMPERGFRITARGRDFCRAGFPWMKLDEYTGDEV